MSKDFALGARFGDGAGEPGAACFGGITRERKTLTLCKRAKIVNSNETLLMLSFRTAASRITQEHSRKGVEIGLLDGREGLGRPRRRVGRHKLRGVNQFVVVALGLGDSNGGYRTVRANAVGNFMGVDPEVQISWKHRSECRDLVACLGNDGVGSCARVVERSVSAATRAPVAGVLCDHGCGNSLSGDVGLLLRQLRGQLKKDGAGCVDLVNHGWRQQCDLEKACENPSICSFAQGERASAATSIFACRVECAHMLAIGKYESGHAGSLQSSAARQQVGENGGRVD